MRKMSLSLSFFCEFKGVLITFALLVKGLNAVVFIFHSYIILIMQSILCLFNLTESS